MIFTHIKHPYHARCVQWGGDNLAEISELVGNAGEISQQEETLVIRWAVPNKYSIECLNIGDWIRRGENGSVKRMPDAELHVKYRRIWVD